MIKLKENDLNWFILTSGEEGLDFYTMGMSLQDLKDTVTIINRKLNELERRTKCQNKA